MPPSMCDYRYGWRWLLPSTCGKTVICNGLGNDDQVWWITVAKIRLGEAGDNRVDGYLIALDDISPESEDNLRNIGGANWVCAWGAGRAVDQLQEQLVGYSMIREYALVPANNPRVVIPLSSSDAAIAGLNLHKPGRLIARVALSVVRGLAYWGSYFLLRRKVLLIATKEKDAVPRGLSPLVLDRCSDFALYLGTPDDNRKTVVLPVGVQHSRLILKVAETAKSRAALNREGAALKLMGGTSLFNQIPQFIALDKSDDRLTLAQEFRPRKSVSHARMTNAVCDFLTQLSMVERGQVALADWLLDKDMLNSSGNLSSEVFDTSHNLHSRLDSFVTEGIQILLHRTHGDFAPWNCTWTTQGLFVYDWEESSNQGLALSDAFYYALSPFVHVYVEPDPHKAIQVAIEFATKLLLRVDPLVNDSAKTVQMYFALWLLVRVNQSPLYVEFAKELDRNWK